MNCDVHHGCCRAMYVCNDNDAVEINRFKREEFRLITGEQRFGNQTLNDNAICN